MAGIIISIVNNKGGTAKTATTVNLGQALAREGKEVLVVDNDSQANATALLEVMASTAEVAKCLGKSVRP